MENRLYNIVYTMMYQRNHELGWIRVALPKCLSDAFLMNNKILELFD